MSHSKHLQAEHHLSEAFKGCLRETAHIAGATASAAIELIQEVKQNMYGRAGEPPCPTRHWPSYLQDQVLKESGQSNN